MGSAPNDKKDLEIDGAVFLSPSRRIAASVLSSVSIAVMGGDIQDDEWLAMLQWGEQSAGKVTASLTYHVSGRVTSKQRSMAAERPTSQSARRIMVLTDSPILRGSLKAYSWLIGGEVAYGARKPSELDDALKWLAQGATFDPAEARSVLRKLTARTPFPNPF